MEASPAKTRVARFGLFEADLEQLVLSKGGLRVRLQDQPFQILAMLLERPGELVTREEIGQKLWSANTFVEFDDGLNTAIRKLRHALGDEADNPRFIETVPRRGYRFIAPVSGTTPARLPVAVTTQVADPEVYPPPLIIEGTVPDRKPHRPAGRRLAVTFLASFLLCVAGAGLAVWRWSRPSPIPHLVRITQLTRSGAVHPNQNLATDGLRLFYIERENGDWVLKSMPSTGGMGTRMDIPMPRYDLQDISPDASEMLLRRITTDAENESIWLMSSVGGPVHRVGDIHVLAAAYTADGRSITYSDGSNVYFCDKDGRNVRKFFSVNGDVLRLRWSPHGDLLRFTLNDPSGTTNVLWEIRADGSGMHPLLPGWNIPKWEWMMGWSHDARWFAFSAARDGGRDIWLLEHDPTSRNSDQKPVQLTAGPIEFDLPLFSANDKRLYAVGVHRHGELLRFDPATRQFTPYLGGISADQLDFSRDRKWVAYVTYPDGVLWRARIDGSEPLKLTETPMRVLAPKWSPNGEQLSFLARTARGGKWQAFIVSAHGGLYQRIASGAEETTGAAWFDNGKTLILSSPEWSELHTLDVATGKLGIFPGTAHLQGALVSPSGRYLIGSNEEGTSFEILDTKTGERKLLARDANYPSWSADERNVYFNRFPGSKPALFRLRLADMKVDTIFDLKTFQAAGSWSLWSSAAPDGSFLIMRDLGGADIYAIDWQPQ
ncbi:MAG TPA: winged helix-turn-helix domain-containing protein [Terracidiphilus sp.]|jgi:DNA-binding winged helix-turn-helix (wHTH) protein/Tol biopolymer transport system component